MFFDRDTAWLTYVLIFSVLVSNVLQLYFLNLSLMHFEASVVVPVYYILFTSASIATGMLLFHETVFEPLVRSVVLFVIGVLLAFVGVYLVDKQSEPVAQHETPLIAGEGPLRVSFQSLEVRNYMCGLRI
jgi:multidrug transporter EmrE-like cation transporter